MRTFKDVSFREQVEIFINNISPGLVERLDEPTIEEIVAVYADSFLVHPPPLHVDAFGVLHTLKTMGLRLGLISNTGMTPGSVFRTYLARHGMLNCFDTLTFSDEVKLAKPASDIFLLTLRSLGVKPEEAIHVGDHVKNDVAGANSLGMKTVWITGYYEREDPLDPTTEPDVAVPGLGDVLPAVAKLAGLPLPR